MRESSTDPYTLPSTGVRSKLGRALWGAAYLLLFRSTPRTAHSYRAFLLRIFGATLGPGCRIYRKASIWAPWNLVCEDHVFIADEAIVYNPDKIYLGSHAIISQQAYLCGATHDYNSPQFPMIWKPIWIERYAWISARANVLMGVRVKEGAVLGLGSLASKDLDAWSVYVGSPARKVADRKNFLDQSVPHGHGDVGI